MRGEGSCQTREEVVWGRRKRSFIVTAGGGAHLCTHTHGREKERERERDANINKKIIRGKEREIERERRKLKKID